MARAGARVVAWLAAGRSRQVGAGFLAGLLAALGQAPYGLWPAALAGLALGHGILTLAGRAGRAAWIGWGVGLGYFGLTLGWIVHPFLVDVARHGWMAPFAWGLMAGGMALFWAAGFALAYWLTPGGRGRWLALAAALGAAELLRAHLWTGFPWGGPGLAWIDTPVAQLARYIGAFGLSVLSFAAAGLLAGAVRRRRALPLAAFGAGLALAFGAGWVAGGLADAGGVPERAGLARAEPARLRLVQPNAPQHLKWDPDWIWTFYDRAVALTRAPADGPPPDLVIWPETAVPVLLGQSPSLQAEIANAARPAPLIAGIRRLDGQRLYNALVLFGGDGSPAAIYDKHHIVPFGEYVPLGDLLGRFGIHGLAAREGHGYSRGPGAQLLALPGPLGRALPLICYEAIFPRDLRAAPGRADWILQITNDAWFGTFSGPYQHLVQARFRAIEFGLPVVRVANTGVSAAIGPRGRVLAALPLGEAGYLDTALPAPLPPTPYARLGDLPLAFLLFVALAAVAAMRLRETG
ncbi:MAG: apolipoprotein N-acyltransferase [Rhodobacterales bacterium]|nr:MAG: apolipoprotein N-acyltransferase [Rhodobacterales bacterium]